MRLLGCSTETAVLESDGKNHGSLDHAATKLYQVLHAKHPIGHSRWCLNGRHHRRCARNLSHGTWLVACTGPNTIT